VNELIEKFALESGIALGNNINEGSRRDLLNKFAESIINECALVARWHVLEHNGISRYYTGNVLVEDAIRNNFKEQQ